MTHEQIRTAILNDAQIKLLAEAGRDADVAAALTAAQPQVKRYTPVTKRTIYGLFGLTRGVAIRAALAAAGAQNAVIAELLSMLDDVGAGGVDVGHAEAPTLLGGLVQLQIITQDEADAILALCLVSPPPITVSEVSAALAYYRPDGKAGVINGE